MDSGRKGCDGAYLPATNCPDCGQQWSPKSGTDGAISFLTVDNRIAQVSRVIEQQLFEFGGRESIAGQMVPVGGVPGELDTDGHTGLV